MSPAATFAPPAEPFTSADLVRIVSALMGQANGYEAAAGEPHQISQAIRQSWMDEAAELRRLAARISPPIEGAG